MGLPLPSQHGEETSSTGTMVEVPLPCPMIVSRWPVNKRGIKDQTVREPRV